MAVGLKRKRLQITACASCLLVFLGESAGSNDEDGFSGFGGYLEEADVALLEARIQVLLILERLHVDESGVQYSVIRALLLGNVGVCRSGQIRAE